MISVIIPVYNTADYLKRCIASVLSSSYENFELILVDDGSDDGSALICREHCEKDSRVKYFRQEHRGVSAARNRGIEESSGTWLVFVDSDDFISSDFLEMIAGEEEGTQEMLLFDLVRLKRGNAVSGRAKFSGDKKRRSFYGETDKSHLIRCLLNMERLENGGNISLPSPCAKAYRKSVIERNRLRFAEDIAICEDRLFNLEYILRAGSFTYIQSRVYFAEVRPGSAMRSFLPDYLQYDIRYQKKLRSLLESSGIFPELGAAYYNSVLSNMADILVRGIFHPRSTRTYDECCRQCRKMQSIEIYRQAAGHNKKAGGLARRVLLFFYLRGKYRIVRLICRISYRVLEKAGRL